MCVLGIPKIVDRVRKAIPSIPAMPAPPAVPLINTNLGIYPDSVPIPYFGDYDNAVACTIGLNPSYKEFTSNVPHPVSRSTLFGTPPGIMDHVPLNHPSSPKGVQDVIDFCDIYFDDNAKKKYLPITHTVSRWFDRLQEVLEYFNYSYGMHYPFAYGNNKGDITVYHDDDGDVVIPCGDRGDLAVHLDIVQWATKPTWGGLSPIEKGMHCYSDNETFTILLNEKLPKPLCHTTMPQALGLPKKVKVIFLDGMKVIEEFCRITGILLKPVPKTSLKKGLVFYYGKLPANGTTPSCAVVGWNNTLSQLCRTTALTTMAPSTTVPAAIAANIRNKFTGVTDEN